MARIDTLANFLTDVATAIKSKTGKTDAITPANFDTEINSIEAGGGSSSKYKPAVISFREYKGDSLTYETENLDTSLLTTMAFMFYLCDGVTSLSISHFNTSNVTAMNQMFTNCTKLTSIDVSSFDTSNVTTMLGMFFYCTSLVSLDLSNFETPALTNTTNMFYYCSNLKHIDMRNFNFTGVTKYSTMFDSVPNDCEIIVADDTQKSWINDKFVNLTNVKTVSEYEGG